MADLKLKPCPFCGGAAKECFGYAVCIGDCVPDHEGDLTVEAWNTRPLEDAKDATIERMRGLLMEARDAAVAEAERAKRAGDIQRINSDFVYITRTDFAARIDAELKGDGDG